MKTADLLRFKAEALVEQGMYAEARALLETLVESAPDDPGAQALLGQVCGYQEDHPASVRHLERACQLDPVQDQALFALGIAYYLSGRYGEGIEVWDRFLQLRTDIAVAYRYKGLCLQELGRDHEAKQEFEQALRVDPEYAEAMGSLANLLLKYCYFDVAEQMMRRAIAIKPGLSPSINDLGRLLQLKGEAVEAVSRFRDALALEPGNLQAVSNILYSLCYLDAVEPEEVFAEHVAMAQRYFPPVPGGGEAGPAGGSESSLRIGYVSNDFYLHSVSFFFEPVITHHDRSRFTIFCYSNRSKSDDVTRRIRESGCHWREISGRTAGEVAQLIRQDQIDILVDLSGHTSGNRLDLFALKPAPVQATWLGYPHSTGLSQVDYYISDAACDPPGMTDHLYTEKVYRMPRVFCCYLPPLTFPPIAPPPSDASGVITFASFNNLAKVSESILRLWAAILAAVPGSRLFLKSAALGGDSVKQQLRERFRKSGIDPERLILMAHAPSPEAHLELYAQVDIGLDSFPYHGTTTTCEALWMGVPVVTLAGKTHASRVGVSLLQSVGLPELVAHTPAEYVENAVALAGDAVRLRDLRHQLRAMMAVSPLMDGVAVTRHVEEAYRQMVAPARREEVAS